MKTVYKYSLLMDDDQEVAVPDGAAFLTVQLQQGEPYLWALVDMTKPIVKRKVLMRGTGHDCEGVGRYISSFQIKEVLIFHVFEGY
jgi:hypothetical protein